MKVHRIITTIEVENDNSITSVELINLHPANADILLAITDITTNGNAEDINKVYAIVDNHRFDIGSKLKDIARIIDDGIICINAYDDKYDDETETDGLI
jgi:Ni,Fe-hydrogenase III small subunit